MAGHDTHGGSDMGAAFTGLLGGMVFIGLILYGIVLWTNGRFAQHKAGETGARPAIPVQVA